MYFQSQLIVRKSSGLRLSEEIIKSFIPESTQIIISKHNQIEIRNPEEKNSIGVKEIEELKEWAYKKSDDLKYAVIYQAEKMTREAQNSILKVLEEPGNNTLIILVTKNENLLISTIRSRCKITKLTDENSSKELEQFADWFTSNMTKVPTSKEFQKRIEELKEYNLQEIIEAIRQEIIVKTRRGESLEKVRNMIELLEILELAVQNKASDKAIVSSLHTFLAKQNIK